MKLLKNSFFQLSRVFLPNWGFYDQVGDQFQLIVIDQKTQKSSIIDFNFKLKPINFLFNCENHLIMAEKNVLEHFISDIQTVENPDKILQLSSYKILIKILKSRTAQQISYFKFKVLFKKNNDSVFNTLFESDWLTQ